MSRLLRERKIESTAPAMLRIEYGPGEAAQDDSAAAVLLEIQYGQSSTPSSPSTLVAQVPLRALDSTTVERWIVDGDVERERVDEFELATNETLLAGYALAPGEEVEHETRAVYVRMLRIVAEHGFQLLRVWNVVPHLHLRSGGLDRYMRFCRGRAEAFETSWGPRFAKRLCAFSAVGSEEGPQVLYFLAGREEGTPRENPRQIPAWTYPARYGPRSPCFARGLRAPDALAGMVFVSGTASIVGHESRHMEDCAAQTRETMRNVRALLYGADDGGSALEAGQFAPVKVYLRRALDRAPVAGILESALGPRTPILYLQADLCRPELLVEIEGLGRDLVRPSPPPRDAR